MSTSEHDTALETDFDPEINLPGSHRLRKVVAERGRQIWSGRGAVYKDSVAGLTVAVASVPEGMAGGVLAGVNPIYGLYANIVGPLAGTMFSSTRLMVIQNTSAVSLVAGHSLSATAPGERETSLFLMVVLAGMIAMAFGWLRLGRMTRFVSYSVMTGFMAGIAAVLVLSQLPTLTGYGVEGANRVEQTFDLVTKLDDVHVSSLLLGSLTLAIAIGLRRTRFSHLAGLIAISIPSVLVPILHLDGVQIVGDLGAIPPGFPDPDVPSFLRAFEVLTGAFAVAVVLLVQGAGVSQSVPNPNGKVRRISQDFMAQGIANVASGLFRGLPVGGSVSTTALNVMAGATRRWAAISSGLWLALVVVFAPNAVANVAMPALGGVIILAGIQSINRDDIQTVWQSGWPARVASLTTFAGMLLLPIQFAVALGMVVSALLHLNEASSDVSLVELHRRPDGRIEERRPPKKLADNEVTVLDVYGHLFFAGARTLERLLPSPHRSERAVVILRLRGRRMIGATLAEVLARYSEKLSEAKGHLYLTGVSEGADKTLTRVGRVRLNGPVRVYEATRIRHQATQEAYEDADAWLVGQNESEAEANESRAEPR